MFGRSALILTVTWSLLITSPLCRGGMIDHACDHSEPSCSHEGGCAGDPCQQPARVTTASRHSYPTDGTPDCVPVVVDVIPRLGLHASLIRPHALPPPTSAIHDSDLPLLL